MTATHVWALEVAELVPVALALALALAQM